MRPKARNTRYMVLVLAVLLVAAMLLTIWALEKGKIKSRHGYQGTLVVPVEDKPGGAC